MSDARQPDAPRPRRSSLIQQAKWQDVALGCGILMILIGFILRQLGHFGLFVETQRREVNQRLEQIEQKVDELAKKVAEKR
jgi:hypothetical protein